MKYRLTTDERKSIDAAIASVEQSTSADLDLVVVRASDRYSLYPLVWAGGAALLSCGLAVLISPELQSRMVILIELAILTVLTMLFDWLPIRLMLVPAQVRRSRARQLAHRHFDAHSATGDPHRSRILFFVSLGEHYVEIIADRDTHSTLPKDIWDKIVDNFLGAVKAGRVADGILVAIESCGALLKTHYPGRKG